MLRPITLQDIARIAGVSTSTASRALADSPLISEEVRALVRTVAKDQNYVAPPRRARTSAIVQPQIMIVMPPYAQQHAYRLAEPFMLSLLGGITIAMRERQQNFTIAHQVPLDEADLHQFAENNPDVGFIFLGQTQYHRALNKLAETGRAFSVWGTELPDQKYCSVGSDNFAGSQRLTNHLLRIGRKRLAFIGQAPYTVIVDRFEGYKSALAAKGVEIDSELIRASDVRFESAAESIDDLLDRNIAFDGIVAASDLLALGAIKTLFRRGVRVPEEVSVVGYDDIDSASYASPALTTVRQDVSLAGRLLVSKVVRQLAGHQATSERLPTELIMRESCGG
jgi:DNA-binding LacI/PurR family transcriptional regulator